ncbi:MAG: SUMF1/EgtB/PvdO family nonheme iron enzyme [Armatimonadota bacterium]|nr:SUMF1/EgtB/PvdO family nonheme iron enzyme [Armatimonadota bacterium]
MMNARWFFSSPWRRAWFTVGLLVLVVAGLAVGRRIGIEWHRGRLMAAEYAPPPEGMVLVPAGYFLMGSDSPEADPDVGPLREVFLPAFYIDRHEVTNAEYAAVFPEHTYPEGHDDIPVSGVLKHEAEAYAATVGKRLPTAAEWEKAARGTDGRQWPWGNQFRPECANVGRLDAAERARLAERGISCTVQGPRLKVEVGSFPCGASPCGALDTAGNVWEWVADVYRDPRPWWDLWAEPIPRGIIRGGAYGYGSDQCRTWYQAFEDLEATCNDVGFRCVRDAEQASPNGGRR